MPKLRARAVPNLRPRALALIAILCASAAAQDGKPERPYKKAAIFFGPQHSFDLTAPDGWFVDNQNAAERDSGMYFFERQSTAEKGLHAFFYPEGAAARQDSPVVMYASAAGKRGEKETLEEFIERDIGVFKEKSPGLKVADGTAPPLDGKKLRVKLLTGDADGNHLAVAYIEGDRFFVSVAVNAKTKDGLDAALPAFNRLVSSYHAVSAVRVKAKESRE